MAVSNPFHCLTLSLLVIPPLLIATYLLASFPHPPEPTYVHKSLASLPADAKSWSIYPENIYPGGGYVSLPYGRVRYWILGPEMGQKIVLIHGLSIPSIVWKGVAPKLASHGFRVLVYDLYGRGYSDAPQTTYDTNLYTIQLALLMQHLRWEKAIITGFSMGGGIAAAFTAQFKELVDDKVVLIASAGLIEATDISRTAKFMSSPVVQTLVSSGPVRTYLQRLISSKDGTTQVPVSSTQETEDNSILEIVRLQSAHLTGFNAAISSSLRDGPIRGQAPAFCSEGFMNRSVLIIHGTKDRTVNRRYAPLIFGLLPDSTRERSHLETVEGAGHDLTVTHADEVSQLMLNFFSK